MRKTRFLVLVLSCVTLASATAAIVPRPAHAAARANCDNTTCYGNHNCVFLAGSTCELYDPGEGTIACVSWQCQIQ